MTTSRRVAIASHDDQALDGTVSGHFGHCPFFTLVDLVDGQPVKVEVIANPAAVHHQPGEVPRFVAGLGAQVILAGGMGRMAVTLFERFGVEVATGATGSIRGALEAWLDGSLTGVVPCRHSEEHHAAGHHHHDH